MSKVGRPTDYNEDAEEYICLMIADGHSLKSICEGIKDEEGNVQDVPEYMPSRVTVYNWLATYKPFLNKYTHAREEQAEKFAQEIVDIADDKTGDVQRDRLRVEARKWVASKLKGSLYGDKQSIDHTTKGEAIQKDVRSMTTEELEAYIATHKDK